MTKFFIKRFQYKQDKNGNKVEDWQVLPCKTNLLPDHRLVKNETK